MDYKIILVAETGSDVPSCLAEKLGIQLVPMHVNIGNQTLADGTFPAEYICTYYDRTGKTPTISRSTPNDFENVFDEIFSEQPQAQVLYLAYSAVTTCSYHSCELALEEKPYAAQVRLVDTKYVSVGQGLVVLAMARWLAEHLQATLEEAAAQAEQTSLQTRMCFIRKKPDYLRAGGRCSNAVALVGNLLHLHPLIEIFDGRLLAGKKYRGDMARLASQLLREFTEKHGLNKEHIYFINTPYMDAQIRIALDAQAAVLGYKNSTWMRTGCVITCHGGPSAFGIVCSQL